VETSVSLGVAFKNKRRLEMRGKETDAARAFVSALSQRNSGPVDRLFGGVLMCTIFFVSCLLGHDNCQTELDHL
jgi:hypothetical protein